MFNMSSNSSDFVLSDRARKYFSPNIASILLIIYQYVDNINLEGTVSQNLDKNPSLICMAKNGKISIIFSLLFFLIRHKIGTRTYIKHLRDGSLQINVFQ